MFMHFCCDVDVVLFFVVWLAISRRDFCFLITYIYQIILGDDITTTGFGHSDVSVRCDPVCEYIVQESCISVSAKYFLEPDKRIMMRSCTNLFSCS